MSRRPTPESCVSGEKGTRIFPSASHLSVPAGKRVPPFLAAPFGSSVNA